MISREKIFFIIIIISFLSLNFQLGSWGITETSEARYAEISKEMVDSNDYLNPTLLGIKHYHKPVITYYITALSYNVFGISEYSSRFFLQIAILLQLLLIYKISLLLYKDKTLALSASLIYFSLPIVLISSRNLTTDAYLNTFILASLYFWLSYTLNKNKTVPLYFFYICLGLAMETKGPVALLFPLTFIITYKLSFKQQLSQNIHHLYGFLLFLIISALWYVILIIDNPQIWNYFIEEQLVNRIASNSFNRGKPFWFYILLVPAVSLPWLLIIIYFLKTKFHYLLKTKSIDFILIASIIILVFIFSLFKTKLILYVLPIFGCVAIVSASILKQSSQKHQLIYNKTIIGLCLFIIIAIPFAPFMLTQYNFKLHLGALFATPIIIALFYFYRKTFEIKYLKTAVLSYVFGLTVLFYGTSFLVQNESQLNSTKEVFKFIEEKLPGNNTVVIYNFLLPSAQFYLNKDVITLNNGHNTVQRETQFEENNSWTETNIDIRTAVGLTRAKALINAETVFVTRKKYNLPKQVAELITDLNHSKIFGNWIIYY